MVHRISPKIDLIPLPGSGPLDIDGGKDKTVELSMHEVGWSGGRMSENMYIGNFGGGYIYKNIVSQKGPMDGWL